MYVQEFKSNEDIAIAYSYWSDGESATQILKQLNESRVYLAWYGAGDYCGCSFVLFSHNGQLYEVNASHCSCYGLEGQWDPEPTCWKSLAQRDYFHAEYYGHQSVNDYLRRLCDENIKTA